MKKIIKIFLLILVIIFALYFFYFFIGSAPKQEKILWGVDFSQMHAIALGLDWKEVFSSILVDLKAKNIKLHTQWDFVNGQEGDYFFNDIDWQIKKAEENDAKIIYVVGIKTGRWPECHIPRWAKDLSKEQQQEELLKYISKTMLRYRNSKAIVAWQVENEPLFAFGECPWTDEEFLKKEVAFVKSLDPTRPVIISDSGEQSSWFDTAKIGDVVGTTMYRKVWVNINNRVGFYVDSFLPPVYYWRKAQLVKALFNKDVICVELQAEPWAPVPYYDISLGEQDKTMSFERFNKNIEYAKKTGLKEFYLWGTEWWYWLKEVKDMPEIWNQAKLLFK